MDWVIAIVAAALVSGAAWAVRALTASGAAAATAVGAVILARGGLGAALVLVLFFLSSSALSALPGDRPRERRGGSQVLANGAVAAAAIVFHGLHPAAATAFLAAIAVATADTWATEVGERYGRHPRSILTLRPVPPGTSGGVSVPGTAAALAGSIGIGLAGGWLIPGVGPAAAMAGGGAGLLGAFADSVMGAGLEERRACVTCGARTESGWHARCASPAVPVSGVPGLNNDAVNALATAFGAIAAIAVHLLYL